MPPNVGKGNGICKTQYISGLVKQVTDIDKLNADIVSIWHPQVSCRYKEIFARNIGELQLLTPLTFHVQTLLGFRHRVNHWPD